MVLPGISGAPLLIKPPSGMKVQDVFNTSLWTGTGAARTITTGIDSGEGALVWIKARNQDVNHLLFDTIRGANNYLLSDTDGGQGAASQFLTAFGSAGYSLGNNGWVNGTSSQTYVGWQFLRAPELFDIVQYTGNSVAGRQIAHNLGIKPGMMIVKRVDAAADWQVYHQSRGATQYGVLNSNATFTSATNRWNNTEPAPSVFTVGNDANVNASGGTYIAYLFAHDLAPEGLIQCGSYVGNGSASGPVVNLGWRPQYLMIKAATATGNWPMIDASRGFTSTNDAILLANTSDVETSSNLANPNSTGFQIASSVSNVNSSGQTYIYMAIREA